MNERWKGIFKLIEECGEVSQIAGKLGPFPVQDHPDGLGSLRTRLENELADLSAAAAYVIQSEDLDGFRISQRAATKLAQFQTWGLTGIPVPDDE